MARIARMSVVLPTPGPPVITSSFVESARLTAARWFLASVMRIRPSTQGMAFSALIAGQGSAPDAIARSRSAMPRSACHSPARKTQSTSPTRSAITARSPSSRSSAVRTSTSGTFSRRSARGTSSETNRLGHA
jgi:hypothetical protein